MFPTCSIDLKGLNSSDVMHIISADEFVMGFHSFESIEVKGRLKVIAARQATIRLLRQRIKEMAAKKLLLAIV
jgi:hypothetical protein